MTEYTVMHNFTRCSLKANNSQSGWTQSNAILTFEVYFKLDIDLYFEQAILINEYAFIKTIPMKLQCMFRITHLLSGKPPPQSYVLLFSPIHFLIISDYFPVPAEEKHGAATTFHCKDTLFGMVYQLFPPCVFLLPHFHEALISVGNNSQLCLSHKKGQEQFAMSNQVCREDLQLQSSHHSRVQRARVRKWAINMSSDPTHPVNKLFRLLPSEGAAEPFAETRDRQLISQC